MREGKGKGMREGEGDEGRGKGKGKGKGCPVGQGSAVPASPAVGFCSSTSVSKRGRPQLHCTYLREKSSPTGSLWLLQFF